MANQYDASFFMRVLMGLCTLANIFAFQAQPSFSRATGVSRATELRVAIDPSVVTKKEIDDIVGADFDKDVTAKRFNENKYLYPKHVEIIEDIAPIAEEMVNEIVSEQLLIFFCFSAILVSNNGCICNFGFNLASNLFLPSSFFALLITNAQTSSWKQVRNRGKPKISSQIFPKMDGKTM